MDRSLTLFLTGICLVPLFFLIGYWLVWWITNDSLGGSEDRMATGYLSILAGLGLAAVGFFLTIYLISRFLQPAHLNYLKIADGVIVVGWIIAWMIFRMEPASQSDAIYYEGYQLRLAVEVRIEKTLLASSRIDSVVSVHYIGGSSSGNFPQPDAVREDSTGVILPWATAPTTASHWYVLVAFHKQPMYFSLSPPAGLSSAYTETAWSDWQPPIPYEDYALPAGVAQRIRLRARYQLIPN